MKDVLTLRDKILYTFFPRRCDFCGCVVDMKIAICRDCLAELPLIERANACLSCANGTHFCRCGGKNRKYEAVVSPFYYKGVAKSAVMRLKSGQRPDCAKSLSEYMVNCVREAYKDVTLDAVACVPLTAKREGERGYNQAELLAKKIAGLLEIPFEALLQKSYDTESQKVLTAEQRRANLFGSFTLVPEAHVQGKTVLLCDDIITTGATLEECAHMLMLHGAKQIYCVTAAATQKTVKGSVDTPKK